MGTGRIGVRRSGERKLSVERVGKIRDAVEVKQTVFEQVVELG